MKLTLVSVVLHGRRFSSFLMLNAESPKVSMAEIETIVGREIPRGTTISIS